MKIIIISNSLTPHQIPLCESLLGISNVQLLFIEASNIDKSSLPIGWKSLDEKDYVVNFTSFSAKKKYYSDEILKADVVVIGAAPTSIIRERNKLHKLTFLYSERIFKNYKDRLKRIWYWAKFHNLYNRNPNMYLLCASAFAANDYNNVGCFKGKTFKWGYFTQVPDYIESKSESENHGQIMWCSRFIGWKHPELPILLASELKKMGYNFHIDMYGAGGLLEYCKDYSNKLKVDSYISFMGVKPNNEIQQAMKEHDIFIFTSDRNEGWGVVANEAMSNYCVLVGSDEIGSVPFLITHKKTGLIFKSGDCHSLTEQVQWLLDNPHEQQIIARNGYKRMKDLWSPQKAAQKLVYISECLINGKSINILEGPCSVAPKITNNWRNKTYDNSSSK